MAHQDTSMERAKGLQRLYYRCEEILRHAAEFATSRWDGPDGRRPAGYFMDCLDDDDDLPHMVNTSTAVAAIGQPRSAFDKAKLAAFEGMAFEKIADYYWAHYDAGGDFWHSRVECWDPYTTAWALRGLARSAAATGQKAFKKSMAAHRKLKARIEKQFHKLFEEFLQPWVKGELDVSLRDYDHVYFVYSALEAVQDAKRAERRIAVEILPGDFETKYQDLKGQVLLKIALEFHQQMTYQLAHLLQYIDPVTLALTPPRFSYQVA